MTSEDFQDQLAGRASLARIDISPALATQLEAYYRLLVHWNARINLTALPLTPITDQAVDRLLIEPLSAARYITAGSPVWFDLGSGGGSPAIPLKLAQPGGQLTMVESKERKAAFLREAVRALEIPNTTVKADRIESVAANRRLADTVDLVTVRAVRVDPTLVGAIRALLRFGGRILFFGAKRADLAVPRGFELVETSGRSSEDPNLLIFNRIGL